jgi:hypothetical protein
MLALSMLSLAAGALAAPLGPTVTRRGGAEMPSIGAGSMGGCGPDSMGTPDGSPCAQYNVRAALSDIRRWCRCRRGPNTAHCALLFCQRHGRQAALAGWLADPRGLCFAVRARACRRHYSTSRTAAGRCTTP